MAFSQTHPSKKLWPSQRKNFFGRTNTAESISTIGTPPMGLTARRLQGHLTKLRGPNYQEKVTTSHQTSQLQDTAGSESEYYDNYERALPKDSFSFWNVKQFRHPFQDKYRALKDYETCRDETHDRPKTPVATYQEKPTTPGGRSSCKLKIPKSVRINSGTDVRSRKELVDLPFLCNGRSSYLGEMNKDLTEADFRSVTSTAKEECDMVKRLCAQALSKRRKALDFYTSINDRLNQRSVARAQAYEPEVYKIPLCGLMVDLLTERDTLLKKRAQKYCKPGVSESTCIPMSTYVPVYCVDGITILGKSHDSRLFQNTFAKMSSLHKSKNDPKGYERYVATVDLRGLKDDEILIHACGNILRFDGCAVDKKAGVGARQRRVTENVKLPEGVYPDRLRIARGDDGVFVIQETWKF